MDDNLIFDADEVETFITSEDIVADSKPAVSLDEDYKSDGDEYDVYNIHFNRLSKGKNKKKKKRKKIDVKKYATIYRAFL